MANQQNNSLEAAEMAAEYEAERQAAIAMREAAVHEAQAKAMAIFNAAQVESAKAAVLNVLAFTLGTALALGTIVAVAAIFRWL